MTTSVTAKIFVAGNVDDLYGFALLFPEGAFPDLAVQTSITGAKDGALDRVVDGANAETYVTGNGCLRLLDAPTPVLARWTAHEIISPLNGYAVLSDSNFTPVVPTSAEISQNGVTTWMHFGSGAGSPLPRLISSARHPSIRNLLADRVAFMTSNPLAAYAASVVAGPPSWADYYRILEDIAGECGSTIDKLYETGLAARKPLSAFTKAANNRVFGRHGKSKRNVSLRQRDLMNLLEARELVRTVVSAWLDRECGGRLPRDRVDGPPLRFGLDEH